MTESSWMHDGDAAGCIFAGLFIVAIACVWMLFVNTGVDSFAYREALKEHSAPALVALVTWDYMTNRGAVFSPDTCVPEHGFSVCFPRMEETFKRTVASQCFSPVCFHPRWQRSLRSLYNIEGFTRITTGAVPAPVPLQPPPMSIQEMRTRITRILAKARNRKSRLRKHLFEMIDVALGPWFVISETVLDFLES